MNDANWYEWSKWHAMLTELRGYLDKDGVDTLPIDAEITWVLSAQRYAKIARS